MKFLSLVTLALAAIPAVFATQPDVEERSPILAERTPEERTFGLLICKFCPDLCNKQRSCSWIQKARCAARKMQCSNDCTTCIPGNNIPTSPCTDHDKVAQCYSIGLPCDAQCICREPPPTVGGCNNQDQIARCGLLFGKGVDANCNCIDTCSCWDQWTCCRNGGTVIPGCKCHFPSARAWKRSEQKCPVGETVCGIMGSKDNGYECINTKTNLESCGGCASTGSGVDCSAIEGASDVACIGGKCIVGSCLPGYTAVNGNSCVADVTGGPLLFAQN